MHASDRKAIHTAITIVAVVFSMIVTAYLAKAGMAPLAALIFLAGTVGGTANNFRRIQNMALHPVSGLSSSTDRLVTIQIYLSPFVGGVFAIVLYLIFMSGFVQGTFFPVFKFSDEPYTTYAAFAKVTEPATHADVAKAILWAFIAGFSEGFVPNVIGRIAKRAGPEAVD